MPLFSPEDKAKRLKLICLLFACAVIIFNVILHSGFIWTFASSLFAIIYGYRTIYFIKKYKINISWMEPVFSLSIGYLFFVIHIIVFITVPILTRSNEEAKNNSSLKNIPHAQEIRNAPVFGNLDGVSLGMKSRKAYELISEHHNIIDKSDGYFSYESSELGKGAYITVWNWSGKKVKNIDIIFHPGVINSEKECEKYYQQVMNLIIKKFGSPLYQVERWASDYYDKRRCYFCYSNNVYILLYMNTDCGVEMHIDQGLCSRAVQEYLETNRLTTDVIRVMR